MKIVAFGEIIWDIYPDERCIGGAPLNFTAHAAQLGAQALLISAVGDDALGVAAREQLRHFGVDDAAISTVSGKPTGQCIVTVDGQNTPHYDLLSDTAYDAIFCDAVPNCDAFVFGTLIQRSRYNRRTLQQLLENGHFGEVFCDLNIRPPYYDAESVERCLRYATILKVSREELPAVTQLLYDASLDVEAAVERICTDVAFLSDGVAQLQGPLSQIKTWYRSEAYLLETEKGEDAAALLREFPDMEQSGCCLTFYEKQNTLQDVLGFVAAQKLSLIKLERAEPTLEALFMEVTGK